MDQCFELSQSSFARLEIILVKSTGLSEMYWRYKYKKFEINFIIVRSLISKLMKTQH